MFDKIVSSITSKSKVKPAELVLGCLNTVAQAVLMAELSKYSQVLTNSAIDFDPDKNQKIFDKMQKQIEELKALNDKAE